MSAKNTASFSQILRKSSYAWIILGVLVVPIAWLHAAEKPADKLPANFVDVAGRIPGIEVDVRYFGDDNFVGSRIEGYNSAKIFITTPAADALTLVQSELNAFGLGLKIFDGYRPQRAVDHFVRWAKDLSDTRMQARYYPTVDKENLFRDGYIAERSGHSRGSTLDLTMVTLSTDQELDMGSGWDFFDPKSWPSSSAVTAIQRENRMLLRSTMVKHGFIPLTEEWWHFTLEDEPFPDTYFDFEIN